MIRFDTFSSCILMWRPLPRPGVASSGEHEVHAWGDVDTTHLIEFLQAASFQGVARNRVDAAIEAEAYRNKFSSAEEHLLSLPDWDGLERLDKFWLDVCGTEVEDGDESLLAYLHETARRFFIGIVARILKPGCKLDTMVVLEGEQGTMKSQLLRVIAFDRDEWFSDSLTTELHSKDAREHLPGLLVVEMAEIGHLKRSSVEMLKSFLSAQDDKYRPAYGRSKVTHKRQNVFVGTTNETGYLKDETGNRRAWLIKCGRIDLDKAREIIGQVYAEALHYYRQGERWWLEGGAAEIADREQRGRLVSDVWDDKVREHVQKCRAAALQRGEQEIVVKLGEILENVLLVPVYLMNKSHETRLGIILTRLGSKRARRRVDGALCWLRVFAVAE
jgi:predicted P-loop ATPase